MLQRFARLLHAPTRVHVVRGRAQHAGARAARSVASRAAAVAQEAPAVESPKAAASFRAAIDFKAVVDNLDAVKENAKNRQSNADADKVAELYAQFTQLGRETDALRQERNENAKAMKVQRTPSATLPLALRAVTRAACC